MTELPCSEQEIEEFIAGFESCTLPKERWTHGAHLLTGACYVHQLGREAALEKMRLCVRRYNASVGGQNTDTSGYHETITAMWIRLLEGLLREAGPIDRVAFATLAVKRFGSQRDIFKQYYDFDLVKSTEARLRWVEPTLRSFE